MKNGINIIEMWQATQKEAKKDAKAELNEAICAVLTTKYKKDARKAHKAVEAAGFTIYKNSGRFGVKNLDTRRFIEDYTANVSRYNYRTRKRYTTDQFYVMGTGWRYGDMSKVDFVNLLNTECRNPYNPFHESEYEEKRSKLKSAKWYAARRTKDVEDTKAEIERLQKRLEKEIAEREEAIAKVESLRVEYGLKKAKVGSGEYQFV